MPRPSGDGVPAMQLAADTTHVVEGVPSEWGRKRAIIKTPDGPLSNIIRYQLGSLFADIALL